MLVLPVWVALGLIAGVVARAVFPGHASMRLHVTVGVAVLGAIGGGLVSNDLFADRFLRFGMVGCVGAGVGAVALLAVASGIRRTRALRR